MKRKSLRAMLAIALCAASGTTFAQAWPAKPIRMIIPYTPGGYTDQMGRAFGEPLGRALGTSVIFENKPGANSILGAELIAKAAPDGYTIGTVIAAHSANATLYPKLPFDVLKDFVPVSLTSTAPLILTANNDFPAKSVGDLIAYAKANPGKVNFGSSGNGAAAHLTMEALMLATGTKMQHIPYKGTAPALTDLIGGQIGVLFDTPASMLPHVRAGKIKALGMATEKRIVAAPDIQTLSESGLPGFVSGSWSMIVAPAGTPPDIVSRLAAEITKIARAPGFREKYEGQGILIVGNSPAEAAAFLRDEVARWGKVIRDANVKAD